jgi:hypothetical protein
MQQTAERLFKIFFLSTFLLGSLILTAQEVRTINRNDSLVVTQPTDSVPAASPKLISRYDSLTQKHNPKKAAIRSAILPGWGQVYNKKYWKVPIVYGALGTCGIIFAYNMRNYNETRFAYRVKYNMRVNGTDSNLYASIRNHLKPLQEDALRNYRNQFRKDIDYSVLVFILLWGLNVVDAAVDAHLKAFDVSPDLSFHFKPGYSGLAGTHGISLVVKLGQ